MSLTPDQKRQLRGAAHHLNPVVLLGNKGLTEAVINEINIALDSHELIKIKVGGEDKAERAEIAEAICANCNAELVQSIGKVVVIYRKKPKEKR